MPKQKTPRVIEELAVGRAENDRFFWSILRGMALAVGLCAFVPSIAGLLYGMNWETDVALVVFLFATYALMAMTPKPEPLPATLIDIGFPSWLLLGYCVLIGLGFNWVCAFLWFSRRYAFFSIPVMSLTVLIMALCAVIALLVGRLTGGNWRTVLTVFLIAVVVPAVVVLRLGLLR